MLYAGLDIHKKNIYGTIVDEKGKIVEQRDFENHKEDLNQFLANRPIQIVIEACGLWMAVYDILDDLGYDVVLAHPGKVEAIASAKMKTDKVDSEILAQLLRVDMIPRSYIPPKKVREDRELVRYRITLVRTRATIKNRIKSVLLKKGLKYRQGIWYGKYRKGLESLDDSRINGYLKVMDRLDEQIKEAEQEIIQTNKHDEQADLLKTIYGISDFSARVILSEIGDITRFPSAKKLKNYSGLTPSIHQSGQSLYHGGITRQGSRWLRWILVQCTYVAIKDKDSRLGRFHARLCKRKKKQVATIATACKMLEIIYAMLRDNKPYIA